MENTALRWLAWEKKCIAVMHERSPREWSSGLPDVLGLTRARYLIEIEIKRSLSDFKADFRKRHRVNRGEYLNRQPRQFYYYVPAGILERCKEFVPNWAGLACADAAGFGFRVVKEAPVNRESQKLTTKECVQFFHKLSNQVVSFSESLANMHESFRRGPWEDYPYEQRYITEPIWTCSI